MPFIYQHLSCTLEEKKEDLHAIRCALDLRGMNWPGAGIHLSWNGIEYMYGSEEIDRRDDLTRHDA